MIIRVSKKPHIIIVNFGYILIQIHYGRKQFNYKRTYSGRD